MPTNKPLWQRGVEAVDKVAAPVLEGATRHEAFSFGLSLVHQAQKGVNSRAERLSRRVLHGMNLPTASDVNRLLVQIAAVENRVRQLDEQIEGRLPSGPRSVGQGPARKRPPKLPPAAADQADQ